MPQFLSRIHDSLIENYIDRGYSKFFESGVQSFAVDTIGFIFPVQIYFSSVFEKVDDFCLNAIILKIATTKQFLLFDAKGSNLGITRDLMQSFLCFRYDSVFVRWAGAGDSPSS